jgi:putative addiction module component (TIGR02574 family)
MGKPLESVTRDALNLSPFERAQLLERIYSSLENELVKERTEKWAAEAELRIDAFERGEIEARPYGEVRKSLGR